MTPFRSDGHLTDLALEHLLAGAPLSGSEDHLRDCSPCTARLAAADDVELPARRPMPSALGTAPQPPTPANRPWAPWIAALAAAVALIAALPLLRGPAEDDGFRVKGGALSFQVFRDGGATSDRLKDGDPIHPGDRLGFRVKHRDGHLLVFGVDAAGAPYLGYPQSGGGASMQVEPATAWRALPEAIRMDDALGRERLFAVHCPAAFHLDDVADTVASGGTPRGCAVDGLGLEKR